MRIGCKQEMIAIVLCASSLYTWADKPSGYRMAQGKGNVICEAMLTRINEEITRRPNGPVCAYDVLRGIPGVTEPGWAKLDLRKHKELYKRFVLAQRLHLKDWDDAFSDPPPVGGQKLTDGNMPGDGELELEWEFAVQRHSSFYRWNGAVPAPRKSDVLLVEIFKPEPDQCAESRAYLYPANMKKPRLGWETGRVPFRYGGRHYRMAHQSQHIAGVVVPRSEQVQIELLPRDATRSVGYPNICFIQLNLN